MYTALTPDAKQKKLFHRVVALMLSLGMMLNWILQVDFTTSVIRANADGESDNLYFNSVQTTIPSPPQVAITNYDYIITTKDEKYTGNSIDTPQPVFNVTASPDTSIDLSLVMNYVFNSQSDLDNIKNNGGYIYYQLPTNLTFDQNYFGSGSKVKDRNYANERWGGADVPSGYYSIWNGVNDDGTKTNPLLVIRFTPDYINYFYNKKYLEGSVEFDGKIYRAETIEGDQTLDFANGPKIQVDFAKDKVTMYKENAQAKTDTTTGAKYLEWKVTITNPKGRTNLTGYTLSDLLNNETFALTSTNCDVSPSDSGYFKDDGTYVFSGKGEGEYHEYYTFTYRQDNPTAGTDYTNKATLKNGDETVTSEATGKLENKLQVEKSGKPDYQDTGERNDSINWKITLENKSGNSLSADKVYLVDPAFRNYKDGTLKVVDADGATMSEDTDYKIVTGKVFYRDGNGNLTDITDVGGADSLTADTNAQIILIDDTYYYITKYDLSDDVIVVEGVPYFKEWNGNADMSSPVRYYKIDTNETEGTTKVYGTRKWNTEDAWVISNNNIIKSSVLQFMGDSATPSATITYSTEVTGLDKTTSKDDTTLNSVSQTNQVFTGSTSESPPTNTSYSASVEYKNELVLLKKEADDGFDEETETFKWKIKVYANASYRDGGQVNVDYNSLETIDGYTVEDAMFKSLTEEELNNSFNCIMNNGSETTEYCKYVTISKVTGSDTKITFTIDKDKMAKDGKTGIISGIELFYNTTAANTLDNTTKGEDGLTEYERYQNHIAVTKTNTATARNENGSYSSSDGVGITAQTRYSAQKSFTDQKTTIIEQDVSQDTQPLNWKIALIKDQGFSKESVVLVDNLGSSTTKDDVSVNTSSKVLHYMTSEQLNSIVLKGRTTQYGTETVIDSSLYTVTSTKTPVTVDGTTTEYITGFQISFEEGIDTANYHYIDVTYQTTANLKDVESGWKTVFTNGCDFGTHAEDTGITYEHEDKTKAKPTTLKINKTWNDNNNVFQTRPETIQVKVLQATVGSDDWKYILDSETEQPKIYTVSVGDNMIIGDDFPQWKAVTENGVTTTVRYQYKIEEVLDADSAYTAGEVAPVTAEGDTTYLNLTNTLTKAVYNKTPDKSSMNQSEITKVTVKEIGAGNIETDVDYYVFKWKVNLNLTQNTASSTIRTFTDTMPNGFIYLTDALCQSYWNNDDYKTVYSYKDGTNAKAGNFTEEYHSGESVTTSGNTITFKVRENISTIEYYTIIRTDEFERALTNGTITNKIRLQEQGETDHPAVVTITDAPEADNENIKKMYKGGSQGTLRYALDFNPQGKKLSNTKYVDITDTLKYETDSNDTLDNLKFALTNLKVYSYNADGTYTELSKNDYRYSVSYSTVTDVQSLTVTSGGSAKSWIIEGWETGKTVTISFSDAAKDYSQFYVEEKDSSNTWVAGAYFTGNSGSGSYTFTVNQNTSSITVTQTDGRNATPTVKAKTPINLPESTLKNTPAILHIEVPDQKYLRIEYTYTVTGYTEAEENSNNKTNVIVSNTASFQTENAAGYDNSNRNSMNVDSSSATSNTRTYPEIYKVDANSLSIDELAAKFKVLKYDKDNKKWFYANAIDTVSGDGVTAREITFGTTELGNTIDVSETNSPSLVFTTPPTDGSTPPITANHKFILAANEIYRFIEIEAPEGYRSPPTSGTVADYDEFTFYYAYALEGEIPSELSSISNRIHNVFQDGRFDIPNSKYVSISAKKVFSGKTDDVPASATVNVKLYWSYYRDGTELKGFESDFPIQSDYKTAFSAEKTIDYASTGTNTVTWQGLPDGYNGKPVYYFVKEQSYKIGDITYTLQTSGENAGKYMSGSTEGKFKPIYVNNGTNSDGDTITINNASGLVIRKEWRSSSGIAISPPKEVDSTLGNSTESISIGFTLTATVSTTQKRVTLNIPQKLNSGNSYEYAIDAGDTVMDTDGNQYSLSELEDYSISESLTSAQSEIADKYVFSPAYEMSNSMGVIKLINTSNLPDKTNITVNKVWIGGRTDAVTVQLYQTQVAGLTSAQIAALPTLSGGGEATPVGSPETLNSENSFTKTWSNQANFDENGVQYYYYVKETSTFEGVTASYEVSVTNTEQKTIITNQEEGKITVIKNWAGMDTLNGDDGTSYQQDVTVELKYSSDGTNWNSFQPSKTLELTSGNSWTDSFTGLAKTDSSSNPIRYKIFERSIGNNQVSDGETQKAGYTISYSDNNSAGVTLNKIASQTITVTNTLATVRIRMVKQWADGEAEHTNEAVTVILNRSTDAQSAPAVTTIASSTESTTTTTTTTTEEQTETETTSFDEKTLYNTEYTHPINNTVSSITIVFDEVSNSGGIDFSIGGVWSKWFWKNNGVLTASYGSGNESYNVSGNTITINFENGGRNVANIKLSAKDMTLGDLWKIASITFVIAGSSSEETTAPSSSTEQTATTTKTVTVGQNFSYQSDGYKVILDSNTIFEAGSQVILHLKSNDNTGNHLFQVAISGNGSNGWINVPKKSEADQGYTGSLNNDGEGTASITIPENLRDVQIQLWNYKEIADDWSSSSIDKEKLTLVSYTITPSSSGNSPRPPQQSSPKPPALTAKSVTAVTAPLASSVMGTQRIYRKGKLAQVEEVIEENQNIASVSAALAVMPRIRMFGYALSSPWSQTVTLSSSGEWSEEITLPAYDENGNPYYYWATETTVQGYTASYQFDDGDSGTIFCINAGNAGIAPQITILNTKTETESTDLPEAGGKGTSPYKAAGFLLMLTAVTFPYIKRKTRNT